MDLQHHVRALRRSPSVSAAKKLAWHRHLLQEIINAFIHDRPASISAIDDESMAMESCDFMDEDCSDGDDDITELGSDDGEDVEECDGMANLEANIHPELMPLPLPSLLGAETCQRLGLSKMVSQEIELRKGQAYECLHRLRLALGLKSAIFRKTIRLAKSQKTKTRTRSSVQRVEAAVRLHVRRYNKARHALVQLGSSQDVLNEFQEIHKEHLKMSRDITEENRFGQRSENLAWFWRVDGGKKRDADAWLDEGEFHLDIFKYMLMSMCGMIVDRVNWLRARARYLRWNEEVTILQHEMRWTVLWFGKQRAIWDNRLGKASVTQSTGHQAYAARQAYLWSQCVAAAQEEFREQLCGGNL